MLALELDPQFSLPKSMSKIHASPWGKSQSFQKLSLHLIESLLQLTKKLLPHCEKLGQRDSLGGHAFEGALILLTNIAQCRE